MIPVGLLGHSQATNQFTPGLLGQGYWLGNQYIIPQFTPAALPPMASPMPAANPAVPADAAPPPIVGRGMEGMFGLGQGAQGETGGFGGPMAPAQGLPAAAPPAAPTAAPPSGIPGLPSLPGLPAAEPPNTMKNDLIAEMKDFMSKNPIGNAPAIVGIPDEHDIEQQMNDLDAQYGGKTPSEAIGMGMAGFGGMGGADPAGPAGAGDHQGAGNPGEAPGGIGGAGDAPYRRGGFVPKDRDKKLEPVRGILHEGEFVINPEMVAMMNKRGLLAKLDRMQKRMVR